MIGKRATNSAAARQRARARRAVMTKVDSLRDQRDQTIAKIRALQAQLKGL